MLAIGFITAVVILVSGVMIMLVAFRLILRVGRRDRAEEENRLRNTVIDGDENEYDNEDEHEGESFIHRILFGDLNNYTWLILVFSAIVMFFIALFTNKTPFFVMLIQEISGDEVTGSFVPWIFYFILAISAFLFTFVAFIDEARTASRKAVDVFDQRVERFKLIEERSQIQTATAPAGAAPQHREMKLFEKFLPVEIAGEVIGEFLISLAKAVFTRFGG